MKNESWYKEGLSFACTECGQCCTGSPGYVWVTEEEIAEMAAFLKISPKDFMHRYVRRVGNRYSLVEMKKSYDCVFLKDRKCQVYGARPTQCRTFPWWPHHLTSPEAWKEAAHHCEGICNEASKVSYETIEEQKLIQLRRNEKC